MRTYLLSFSVALVLFISACGSENKNPDKQDLPTGNKSLPFLGEPQINFKTENGVTTADTVQHQIPPFSFTDQDGNTVNEKTVEGKVYVVDFIFTSCPSICPIMTNNLKTVQDAFKTQRNFMILSHSIDPDFDQPAVLRTYADEKGADTQVWKFLTGNRDSIYNICENQYMAFAKKDNQAPGGYIHSGFFILIDKNRHIRGAYDGTEEGKTEELISDIKILLEE